MRTGLTRRRGIWLLVMLLVITSRLEAQTFSSGSDGSDGTFAPQGPPGTVVIFDPSQFHGNQVGANIFNFTTITIPAGVTVRLSGNVINGPVVWLAQGDVTLAGVVDLGGRTGHAVTANPFGRVVSESGSGGYAGGVGGNSDTQQPPRPGDGPGGGTAGVCLSGGGGAFTGNQFLIPMLGGSGGGGLGRCGLGDFGSGGGAGGGALLVASSTQINFANGQIRANGGDGILTLTVFSATGSGGGAGGALRLVSNTIRGTGLVTASGGCSGDGRFGNMNGSGGRIRLEAYNTPAVLNTQDGGCARGAFSLSAPFPLLMSTAGPPTARVISIAGVPINPNPNTFPDITINDAAAVPVVIQTRNIPTTATLSLTILNQNGVADTVIQVPALGNCDASNTCTATVNVVFPFGGSRGLTKVTWTQ